MFRSKFLENKFTLETGIASFFIGIYFLIRLPYFLSDAFLPDELWHSAYMQYFGGKLPTNYQGHGTGFWIFGLHFFW